MELSSEEAVLLLLASENVSLKLKNEKRGVHDINKSRGVYGEYHHLFHELKIDGQKFFEYFRMEIETFNYILEKIEHRLLKDWCNYHQQEIFAEERLMLTLRYLFNHLLINNLIKKNQCKD